MAVRSCLRAASNFPILTIESLMPKSSDPTKDPEFQKVVQAFLHTKPQPHKPIGKRKPKSAPKLRTKGSRKHD
jgi:hypothetical protein